MRLDPLVPDSLRYLQPFVDVMARIAPGKRNEDINTTPLEQALRQRIATLDPAAAQAQLTVDREQLDAWLKTSAAEDHPAYWVLGFLSLPDLATQLLQPVAPPARPTIHFEIPDGWKVKARPGCLELKKGKLLAIISAIDELGYRSLQSHHTAWPPGLPMTRVTSDVAFGDVVGKKYLYPQPFKRVEYVLVVPTGYASVTIAARTDFDETPFEAKLATLQLG